MNKKNKTWTEKLSELQVANGYMNNLGKIDNIAALGFAGEAGEVINEIGTQKDEYKVYAALSQFAIAGRHLDFVKKSIRDGKMEAVDIVISDRKALIEELADNFYYQNALLLNLGITHETLAELVFNKVTEKLKQNPDWRDKR